MREKRKQIANETLRILRQGYYVTPSGKRVNISDLQNNSEDNSYLLTPEQGYELVRSIKQPADSTKASYEVKNISTVTAIIEADIVPGVLNFASARNPGGGFLNGAMAQEEALAISGGLYNTLVKHMIFYEANKACDTPMYTNHAIYSPAVPFFRDTDYKLLDEPVTASILTLPAVNMGCVRTFGESINEAKKVMKDRMRLALSIFAYEHNAFIILGAYGCGVFKNDPYEIATWWKELLNDEGFDRYFEKVLFAVMDKPGGENIKAFKHVMRIV